MSQPAPKVEPSAASLTLADIRATATLIAPHVLPTPVHRWRGPEIEALLGPETEVVVKLELFQRAGSFKARGAVATMLRLSDEARARGVTAVSAGNHAIAVAYAAAVLGVSAKVVMLATASPARIEGAPKPTGGRTALNSPSMVSSGAARPPSRALTEAKPIPICLSEQGAGLAAVAWMPGGAGAPGPGCWGQSRTESGSCFSKPSRRQPRVRTSQFGASTLVYPLTCPQVPT